MVLDSGDLTLPELSKRVAKFIGIGSEPGFFDLEHGGKVIREASSNGYRAEGFDEEDAGRAV